MRLEITKALLVVNLALASTMGAPPALAQDNIEALDIRSTNFDDSKIDHLCHARKERLINTIFGCTVLYGRSSAQEFVPCRNRP